MLKLLATIAGSMGVWILFVAGVKPEEMIVGVICVLLTVAFSWYIVEECSIQVRLRWIDMVQIVYVPGYLIAGMCQIVSVLALDILRIRPSESLFRAAPFEKGGPVAVATARRVLAVVYTTATPNFIILGIDPKTHWMLFYQLRKSDIPVMTRHLGARA
ncbi:MAG: hypothetical protein WA708_07940 [Acidobacteriaceae bacterium]